MSDLPIKVSSVSAKPATAKPAENIDAPQDGQDFGNVLARQVDSGKPAETAPRSSGEAPQQSAKQDATETKQLATNDSALPADIMAALLAQQGQVATPQPAAETPPQANIQDMASTRAQTNTQALTGDKLLTVTDGKIAAGAPATQGGKQASTAPALPGGKTRLPNASMPEADITLPNNNSLKGKGLADTFKAAVTKELTPSSTVQQNSGKAISELSGAMLQSGVITQLAAPNTAPTAPLSISTAVTQPAWGDEFSQKVTWMASQHSQTAELHLNPPQLGPLDVVLKMNGDQASATFTSPHAAVREAIEQAIPKLREMLADSGIMLGNAMVNDQAAKNGQDSSPRTPRGRATTDTSAATLETGGIQDVHVAQIKRHNGMVDTFA